MTAVSDSSLLHDTIIRIKELLASGIEDPLSRGGAGSAFIMSSFPERKINFPIITIKANYGEGTKLGMYSIAHEVPINVTIDLWTRNTKQRDEIGGSIFNLLRSSDYTGPTGESGTEKDGLEDVKFMGSTDLDEPGKDGLHRKILNVRYKHVTQG